MIRTNIYITYLKLQILVELSQHKILVPASVGGCRTAVAELQLLPDLDCYETSASAELRAVDQCIWLFLYPALLLIRSTDCARQHQLNCCSLGRAAVMHFCSLMRARSVHFGSGDLQSHGPLECGIGMWGQD